MLGHSMAGMTDYTYHAGHLSEVFQELRTTPTSGTKLSENQVVQAFWLLLVGGTPPTILALTESPSLLVLIPMARLSLLFLGAILPGIHTSAILTGNPMFPLGRPLLSLKKPAPVAI